MMISKALPYLIIAIFLSCSMANVSSAAESGDYSGSTLSVTLLDKEGNMVSSSAGVLLSSDGSVATINPYNIANSIIDGFSVTLKTADGKSFTADKVLAFDDETRLVILKTNVTGHPSAKLSLVKALSVGDTLTVSIVTAEGGFYTVDGNVLEAPAGGLITLQAGGVQIPLGSPAFDSTGNVAGLVASYQFENSIAVLEPAGAIQKTMAKANPPKPVEAPKPAPAPSASDYFKQGITYGKDGKYQEAVDSLQHAINLKPNYSEAYLNLGNIYTYLGNYEGAVQAYKNVIRIKPDFAVAYFNLGVAYGWLGDRDGEISSYKEAVRIRPSYHSAEINLGLAYINTGKYAEAQEVFENAIKIKPTDYVAYHNLGLVFEKQKKYQEAVDSYEKSIKLKPDYAESHFRIGVSLIGLGSFKDALASLEKARSMNSSDPYIRCNLGIAYWMNGNHQEAMKEYRTAIKLKPDYADAHYYLARLHIDMQNRPAALEEYKTLKNLDPSKAESLYKEIYK